MNNNITRYSAVIALLLIIFTLRLTDFQPEILSFDSAVPAVSEILDLDTTKPTDKPIATLRDFSNAMVAIAEEANPTVVTVFTERTLTVRQRDLFSEFFGPGFFGQPRQQPEREYRQAGQGSGVIVSPEGYIITNNHVIQNADTVRIRTIDNKVYPARVVGADPNSDIAILKVEVKGLSAMRIGDSDKLRVGEWILAIGSPLDENLAHTVTMGIVSAKGRTSVGILDFEDFIQTDAAINPGNSGGALINLDGELVGINTAIASRTGGFQGIGFAIPINMVRYIMQSIIETGKVVRPWLGIQMQEVSESVARAFGIEADNGVIIAQVLDDGPAKKAGLKDGDVILEVDGRKVNTIGQVRTFIGTKAPGSQVRLKILRDGKQQDFTIRLEDMPTDEAIAAMPGGLFERLGYAVNELTREKAGQLNLASNLRGVLVGQINAQSKAYANGLRENDLIVAVNRRAVRTTEEFNQLISQVQPGNMVLLQIVRGRNSQFVAFEL